MADHNISIDVQLKDEKVLSELKAIREDLNNIKNTHVTIDVKANVKGVTQSINNLRREMADFASLGAEMNTANIEFLDEKFQSLIDKLGEINSQKVDIDVNSDQIEVAASRAERLAAGLDVAAGLASSAASVFSGLGDFGGMFADSFGTMSGLFKTDITRGIGNTLVSMATRAVTGQFDDIIQRYDIMNTFTDYMELAGVSSNAADAALSAVDQSIRGIPIGLDEAAFRLRKYQMYMGDIDRATRFTIGIQKAITAGGASEQMKTTAYTQIDRLLATGKLGQSRQWLSLFNGMGVSLKFLREELALDPTADLKEIAGDLANGTIPVEDFLGAIERLSENEGLDRALEIYKGTIEAWASNINNAIKRGGQNIMESANSVMEDVLGFGITGAMRRIRDGIDDISEDAGNYIIDNPQHVQTIGDAVNGLIERAMSLDGGRFVTNVVENLGGIASAIGAIFDSLPPGFLEDFTAFATTWAGPMAAVMKAAQSGFGVVLGVFDRMKNFDMADLMGKITDQIWNMSEAVSTLLGWIPDGLLGDLMAFGLVWGKPLASVLGSISGALKDISGVVAAGGSFSAAGGIFGQITSLAMNHPILAVAATAITAFAASLEYYNSVVTQKEIENMQMHIGDITSLVEETDALIGSTGKVTEKWEYDIGSFNEKAEEAHRAVEKIQELNQQIDELSQPLPYSRMDETRDQLLAERMGQIERLSSMFPDLKLEVDEVTGALTEQSQVMLGQADAYIDYMTGVSLAKGYREAIEAETDAIVDLQLQREKALETQTDVNKYLSREERSLEHFQQEVDRIRDTYRLGNKIDEYSLANDPEYQKALDNRDTAQRQLERAEEEAKKAEGNVRDLDNAIKEHFNTIDKYGRSLSELRAQQVKYSGTEWWYKGEKTALENLDESLQNIIADYEALKEEARTAAEQMIGGFAKIEDQSVHALSETNQILSGNNAEGEEYRNKLTQLWGFLDERISLEDGQEWVEQNGAAIQQLIDEAQSDFGNRGLLYGLVDAITGGDTESVQEYFQNQLDQTGIADTIADLTANIEAALKHGKEWTDFVDENQDEEEFGWMKGLTEGVIQEVQTLSEALAPGGDAGSVLTEAATQTMEGVTQSVEPVKTAFDEAKQSASDFEGAVSDAASTASSKAGEMSSLAGSLDSVASSAAKAFSNVSALAAAISRLQDKTVNIRINVSAGLGRLAQGGMAGFFASGGNVGLGFPGMASGTDTIPAWLTPGEYVMRRAAVGLFGSRFMDRVNKMDIGGAFDALMSRISNPMNLRGATYNRDNHATVNNYFYGDSGQNYSQRKAYRWVGSL